MNKPKSVSLFRPTFDHSTLHTCLSFLHTRTGWESSPVPHRTQGSLGHWLTLKEATGPPQSHLQGESYSVQPQMAAPRPTEVSDPKTILTLKIRKVPGWIIFWKWRPLPVQVLEQWSVRTMQGWCAETALHGVESVTGSVFCPAHSSCGRSAFQMGSSSEGEGHEGKEQGPPVFPQGEEREDELRQRVQELTKGRNSHQELCISQKANLCSNLTRKFMAYCRIHNPFEDNYIVCYLYLNSLH